MLFMPITRLSTLEPVMAALNASDIPREACLLVDTTSDVVKPWVEAFHESGWSIYDVQCTNNFATTHEGTRGKRLAHLKMRRFSQAMTQNCGRVLYTEDDTLVTPDVWSRLSALLDKGYLAASGVQRDRHGTDILGLWHYDKQTECFDPLSWTQEITGIVEADAVGHFCLMTTGQTYANAVISTTDTPIDRQHTFQMRPIAVDTAVWCGHIKPNGEVVL